MTMMALAIKATQFTLSGLPSLKIAFEPLAVFTAGFLLWALILLKMATRPRRWSVVVGIFLWLAVAFHIYYRWKWAQTTDPAIREHPGVWQSLLRELPLWLAAVGCVLLRVRLPKEHP